MTKFIFVTGGVVSGLGKGIVAASLGRLLKARGYKVTSQKLDPYINVDPGTMSPYQHGEVFVTEDGCETDLDLGHYERFIDENLHVYSNLTTGKVYWEVLNRERDGGYLGETVQVIPHITNEIKNFIYKAGEHSDADIVITEIGGTVGDIESLPFLESIRQVAMEKGRENCVYIHVTLVPYLHCSGEYKTKPTQHSVKELQSYGITPDIIVARSETPLNQELLHKIASSCNVQDHCVIANHNLDSLYKVVPMLEKQGLASTILNKLHLEDHSPDLEDWTQLLSNIEQCRETVEIGLIGKYVQLHDAYLSVVESLNHGGFANHVHVNIHWIDSESLEDGHLESLEGLDGILIPGGFGHRGIEGKIQAATYARVNNIPYLGICLGMQIASIAFARSVLGYEDANSSEFDAQTKHAIIDFMEDQRTISKKGGTMRLGAYPCYIKDGSKLMEIYGQDLVMERHRHRYEFNNAYRQAFEENGMTIGGTNKEDTLVESVEIKDHPYYIGVQFHPEFKSRPNRPHPLFQTFIQAAKEKHRQ